MLEDELSAPPDALPAAPPVETVAQSLPFGALSWQNFERLCYRLARQGADVVHCARYGEEGEAQHGIDIFVRLESGRYDAWQVKRHKRFSAKDVRSAVDKFLAGKWSNQADHFRLAVQRRLSGTRVQDEIERQAMRLRDLGITFLAWGADELSDELRTHAQLVRDFFGTHWVKAFIAAEEREMALGTPLSSAFAAEGLAETCAQLTDFNLDRLKAAALFRPDRTIARAGFDQALDGFVAADEPIMPLVGLSGVGKTTVLARAAASGEELPPCILLRGADIVAGQEGLPGLVVALAQQRFSISAAEREDLTDTIRRLPDRVKQPLLLLLDGLNESSIPLDELRTRWLPATLEWLSRGRIKLLLSCRPEFWEGIRDAWPSALLHPAPPKPKDGEPPAETAAPRLIREVRLGDFSPDETQVAIEAYGLQDSLRAEDARHPFVLAVAEALADAAESYADIPRVLTRLVEHKIRRALGRSGNVTAYPRVQTAVQALAFEMFEAKLQVIEIDRAETIFARDLAVLDALTEEHLLVLDMQGYRFQFDQVREMLQAVDLSARDVLAEITLLPEVPERHWLYRFRGQPLVEIVTYNIRNARLREVRMHQPRLSASVASFVALRCIAVENSADAEAIFEALYRATDPARNDRGAAWAAEAVQLIFDRMSGEALSNPIVRDWLDRFVRRPDDLLLTMRNEEILHSASRALIRSQLPVAEGLALAPSFMMEDTDSWSGSRLPNKAHWERYGRAGDAPTLANKHLKSPAARLLENLAASDSTLVVTALLDWLASSEASHQRPRSIPRPLLGEVAAECLYYLRGSHRDLICKSVLRLDSAAAAHLLEAMAIAETDSMISACLAAMTDVLDQSFDRAAGALWTCCRQAMTFDSRCDLLDFAEAGIEQTESPAQLWAARIALQQFEISASLKASYPDLLWPVEIMQRLAPSLQRSFDILLEAIRASTADMKEDYSVLFRHAFNQMLGGLETATSDDFERHPLLLPALLSHLSVPDLRKGHRTFPDYIRVVELLSILRTTGGEDAATSIGWFAICSTTQTNYNQDYYFSAEEVDTLGLVDLAVEAIGSGSAAIFRNCCGMKLPEAGPVRDRIVEALARSSMSDADFGEMIASMCRREHEPDNEWLFDLLKLRVGEHIDAWDDAMLYFLTISSSERQAQLQTCIDVWRATEREALPARTREFFEWMDMGLTPASAVKAVFTTPYYKKLLRAEHSRGGAN